MRLLIDTQILIWWQLNDGKLNSATRELMAEPDNTIYVSPISLIEIAIKQKLGKLPELEVPVATLADLIEADGFDLLPLKTGHIQAYADIPLLPDHRDPFDRLLLAVAFHENTPIISADGNFDLYNAVARPTGLR